jgi:hypothetical protein
MGMRWVCTLLLVVGIARLTFAASINQMASTLIMTAGCTDGQIDVGFNDLAVLAQSSCPSATAFSAVGRFGDVGMSATQRTAGQVETVVDITSESDANRNPLPSPQHAEANFILDGGSLVLDGVGTLFFNIEVHFRIFDSHLFIIRRVDWTTGGTLTDRGLGLPTFLAHGVDIGYTHAARRVEIPRTFVTLDLGNIPIGGAVAISYTGTFRSDLLRTETAGWVFSDPGSISGVGDFPVLTFADVPPDGGGAPIPEPATVLLVAVGFVLLVIRKKMPGVLQR